MKTDKITLTREQVELINACLLDIVRVADRTTSGNIAHNRSAISAMAQQGINILNNDMNFKE